MAHPLMEALLQRVLHPRAGTMQCHLITLYGLALSLGARNILELGHLRGETTTPLLMAAKSTNGSVTSVDLSDSSYVPPDGLGARWAFHKGDSVAFVSESPTVWDIVLVDDWHAAAHVRSELAQLANKTRLDSVVVLHDVMTTASPAAERGAGRAHLARYNARGTHPRFGWASTGYDVFDGLRPSEWEFMTIPSCHGMTLLRKLSCWDQRGFDPLDTSRVGSLRPVKCK